jgi:hypothetical protein
VKGQSRFFLDQEKGTAGKFFEKCSCGGKAYNPAANDHDFIFVIGHGFSSDRKKGVVEVPRNLFGGWPE